MTAPLDEKGLLPCPFCGATAKIVERHNPMSKWRYSVDCASTTCGMSGPVEASAADAINAWNRRAYLAASPSPSMEMEVVAWPLGGYAPGDYTCMCLTCKASFIGDKRAHQCLPCAASQAQSALAAQDAQVLRLTEENEALRKERDGARQAVDAFADICDELGCERDNEAGLEAAHKLKARIKALEEALRPFAAEAEELAAGVPDNAVYALPDFANLGITDFTVGHLRSARLALKENAL